MSTRLRRIGSIYVGIGRTYWAWGPSLLLLATVIFLPLGLLETIPAKLEADSFEIDTALKLVALLGVIGLLTTTSLLGEVFYSGAVAVFLTHPEGEEAPGLRAIARRLDYRTLIVVDVVYVLMVIVGLLIFVVPGALAFVWFGLAGPVVEIEGTGVRGALRRSWRLVRGSFWTVAAILVPIELAGDALGEGLTHLVHDVLGDSFLATWLADSAANIVLTPLFAIAAVLLTLKLIRERDGEAPALNTSPLPVAP